MDKTQTCCRVGPPVSLLPPTHIQVASGEQFKTTKQLITTKKTINLVAEGRSNTLHWSSYMWRHMCSIVLIRCIVDRFGWQ